MKPVDFVVLGIIGITVLFSILKMIKNKKNGKCNCGCNKCSTCDKVFCNSDREKI